MSKLASQPVGQPFTTLDNLAIGQPAFPGANESRIYFDGAALKVSLGGAAYVPIATGVVTLQGAYNGGNTIATTSARPVAISQAAGVSGNMLTLTDGTTASNSDNVILATRTSTPANGSVYNGSVLSISNTPNAGAGNTSTESSTMVKIVHGPLGAGGTIIDNTTAVGISMLPLVGAGGVTGVSITMGANCGSASTGIALQYQSNIGQTGTTASLIYANRSASIATGGESEPFVAVYNTLTFTSASQALSAPILNLQNKPTVNANTFTITGTQSIVNVNHQPTVTAGTYTDSTVGIAVAISPASVNTAVLGISVTMSANASGALAALFTGASISCPQHSQSERFGQGATCSSDQSVSVGYGASCVGGDGLAIGWAAATNASSGVAACAIGHSSVASKEEDTAIGFAASGTGSYTVVIGSFAAVNQQGGVAIGSSANIVGQNCVAIGFQAGANNTSGTAVGYQAKANNQYVVAIGAGTAANGLGCTAVGSGSTASVSYSTALGTGAVANANGAIALGAEASVSVANTLVAGGPDALDNISSVFIGNGITHATPVGFTLNATGGLGAGVAGASITIAGGKSGNAATAGGSINFQTTQAGTGQTLVTVVSIANTGHTTITVPATTSTQGLLISNAGTGAALNLAAQTTPTVTVAGDLWSDTTQKALFGFQAGMKQAMQGVIATQSAVQTIANSAATTSLFGALVGTKTLPANFFTVGKTVRITISGIYSTQAVPGNVTVYFQGGPSGTTLLATTGTVAGVAGSATNQTITIVVIVTCQSVGVAGTLIVSGYMIADQSTLVPIFTGMPNTAAATIDTTNANALDMQWAWSTASASNIITTQVATIEVMN